MAVARHPNFDSDFFNKYSTFDYYISKGASGTVYGPIPWNDTQLAIKQVMFADGKVTDEFKKDLKVKKEIWTSLEHKHLMRIHSVDLNRLPKVMFIVMEFAAGGSLNKILRSLGSETKLPIDVVTDWAKQIAEGMLYLHEKNIVHRDLKSSNILLMAPYDNLNSHKIITLKITDFDDIKEHDHTTTMSFVGTYAYMAPEVLKGQRFSKASDVWSYGVVIWEMLSGDIPYKELEPRAIIYMLHVGTLDNLPLEQSFTEDYKLLLKRCWESTCGKRPSFDETFDVLQRMAQEDVTEILNFQDEPEVSVEEAAENDDSITDETNAEDEDVTNERLQYDRYVLDEFPDPPASLPKGTDICGLAILDQEVFILRLQGSDIEVYDSRKFHLKRRMEVERRTFNDASGVKSLADPDDMVSCSVNNCLYVSDHRRHSERPAIIIIDPTTGDIIKAWTVSFGGCISIANDTNLILSNGNMLLEYTADGDLIREIKLRPGTGIDEARHAVKLPNGLFVVCHGYNRDHVYLLSTKVTSGDRCYRTDEVEIVTEFCLEGESVFSLWLPRNLSVDKEGSVLVLAGSNYEAVLLSSNLDKLQIIISKEDGMKLLRRACFDESTGQWFVADNDHVMVCRVKDNKVERKRYSLNSH